MRQPVQFGKYLLLDRIAVGGMAEVFAAKAFGAAGFERILAIKKILPTMGEDPELVSMFVDEARIAVQLSHPGIVQVLELGKHDETLYIAMEYISGRDLRQLLDRFRRRGHPMPIPYACAIAARVCDALDYAHRKRDASGNPLGIVHRDVSPQNVLVSFDGAVKLIDFGIAKAEQRLQKTQSGILKGKFSYMSPEQVRGEPLDHRSDVFAAGALLWELICGRKLFTGDSDYAVLEKVRKVDVPPPASVNPQVPKELSRVVLGALAPDPRDRYQWCSELHDGLLPFAQLSGAPLLSRQLGAFVCEELPAEREKEQARLQRWMKASARARAAAVARTEPDAVSPRAATPTVEVDSALLEEQLGPTQRTHVLAPGEGTVPQFDNSSDATAARRSERSGALSRPRRKGRRGAPVLWLVAGAAAGAIALAGVAYVGLRRGPAPAKSTVRPAEVQVALAQPEAPPREEPSAPEQAPILAERPETKGSLPAEQRGPQRRRPSQMGRLLAASAPMAVPAEDPDEGSPAAEAAGTAAPQRPRAAGEATEVEGSGARLHVMSDPIGAEIRLAGRSIGRAPLTTDLLPPDRDYDLSASLEGYVGVSRVVRPRGGVTDVTLRLPLQPIAGAAPAVARAEPPAVALAASIGYLVTNTRPAARVSIDGHETGRWTPVPDANPIALPAGAHTVVFETADGKRLEEMLQIEPGKTTRLVREIAR